jgi:hypothetical protein
MRKGAKTPKAFADRWLIAVAGMAVMLTIVRIPPYFDL